MNARPINNYILAKIAGKIAVAVMAGFEKGRKYFVSKFCDAFKSITTDNGSEFAELINLEEDSKTLVCITLNHTLHGRKAATKGITVW